jgi:hypothetical protein
MRAGEAALGRRSMGWEAWAKRASESNMHGADSACAEDCCIDHIIYF